MLAAGAPGGVPLLLESALVSFPPQEQNAQLHNCKEKNFAFWEAEQRKSTREGGAGGQIVPSVTHPDIRKCSYLSAQWLPSPQVDIINLNQNMLSLHCSITRGQLGHQLR